VLHAVPLKNGAADDGQARAILSEEESNSVNNDMANMNLATICINAVPLKNGAAADDGQARAILCGKESNSVNNNMTSMNLATSCINKVVGVDPNFNCQQNNNTDFHDYTSKANNYAMPEAPLPQQYPQDIYGNPFPSQPATFSQHPQAFNLADPHQHPTIPQAAPADHFVWPAQDRMCGESPQVVESRTSSVQSPPRSSIIFPRRKAGQAKKDGQGPVHITIDILESMADVSLIEAVKKLGVSSTALKTACRKLGVLRWPYRKRLEAPHQPKGLVSQRKMSYSAKPKSQQTKVQRHLQTCPPDLYLQHQENSRPQQPHPKTLSPLTLQDMLVHQQTRENPTPHHHIPASGAVDPIGHALTLPPLMSMLRAQNIQQHAAAAPTSSGSDQVISPALSSRPPAPVASTHAHDDARTGAAFQALFGQNLVGGHGGATTFTGTLPFRQAGRQQVVESTSLPLSAVTTISRLHGMAPLSSLQHLDRLDTPQPPTSMLLPAQSRTDFALANTEPQRAGCVMLPSWRDTVTLHEISHCLSG